MVHTLWKKDTLGFDVRLFGDLAIKTYDEDTRSHEALVYDGSGANIRWEPLTLPVGQKFREPQALYKKLDEKEVLETELARLGS